MAFSKIFIAAMAVVVPFALMGCGGDDSGSSSKGSKDCVTKKDNVDQTHCPKNMTVICGKGCDQSGLDTAVCEGGKCNQSEVKNATCPGMHCDQTHAGIADCKADCQQSFSQKASCVNGGCNQTGVTVLANCSGLVGGCWGNPAASAQDVCVDLTPKKDRPKNDWFGPCQRDLTTTTSAGASTTASDNSTESNSSRIILI